MVTVLGIGACQPERSRPTHHKTNHGGGQHCCNQVQKSHCLEHCLMGGACFTLYTYFAFRHFPGAPCVGTGISFGGHRRLYSKESEKKHVNSQFCPSVFYRDSVFPDFCPSAFLGIPFRPFQSFLLNFPRKCLKWSKRNP